jgi:ribosomal protein L3 glutamine methyltransferase
LHAKITHREKAEILELFHKRIAKKIPAAYLINEAWFAGMSFYVDKRVLIPRSSIGELIHKHFAPWIEYDKVKRILDIGTGSGCIAIACARAFPESKVDAVDISATALEVAKQNTIKHHVENRVKLIQSDVFASVANESYDIIVSNPPYVTKAEIKTAPKEYSHEPKLALEGGKDGLDVVVKILKDASNHLSAHGILIVEVGNSEQAVQSRFPKVSFTWLEFEQSEGGVFLLTAQELKTIKF